jgi:hypothetical protein
VNWVIRDQKLDINMNNQSNGIDTESKSQQGEAFFLFSKLPIEARLLIWGYTWPEPRLIEGAIFESDTPSASELYLDDEDLEDLDLADGSAFLFREIPFLRLAGPLSIILREGISRRTEDSMVHHTPHPSALQVCQESRNHTLRQYIAMEHTDLNAGSFYFNPSHDALWFSLEFVRRQDRQQKLKRYYAMQLNSITTIIADKTLLMDETSGRYLSSYLGVLDGVKEVQLVHGEVNNIFVTTTLLPVAQAIESGNYGGFPARCA